MLPVGATLPTTTSPYHDLFRRPRKTGTFYFAQNWNFLLCLDRNMKTAFVDMLFLIQTLIVEVEPRFIG